MKPVGSSRSLTNGSNARAALPPPLASSASASRMSPSSKKHRRASLDKPPLHVDAGYAYAGEGHASMAPSPELLFQLQQLQHQQQIVQHNMAGAVAYGFPGPAIQTMPAGFTSYLPQGPMMQRMPSGMVGSVPLEDTSLRQFSVAQSGPPTGQYATPLVPGEDGEDLLGRIEKKDQMITQLGSFLSQMKQESEGTAHAWKEKMQEIAELKRQLASVGQKLRESQEKERKTAGQLTQVTADVELAVHGLKESETKHLEELKIMNDEIQRRQQESDQMKHEYEAAIQQLADKLSGAQQTLEGERSRCVTLEDSLKMQENGHRLVMDQFAEQHRAISQQLDESRSQIQIMDKEKQEVAQHLWNVTQVVNKSAAEEESLRTRLEDTTKQLEQCQAIWNERFQSAQCERTELISNNAALQSQVQTLQAKVQEEQSQKEQINSLMGEEMGRVNHEIQALHQQYATKLEQNDVEIEHWKTEATALQENLVRLENQYTMTRKELDEWQARAAQIDEEYQELQKNGTEKAYTLQEMNEQMRLTLGELHDTKLLFDQIKQRCQFLEGGVTKCVQHLQVSSTDGEEPLCGFPENIVKALDDWAQQVGHLEQIRVSTLRLQQDRDNERERFRAREQELVQKTLALQADVDSAKADATALTQEVQDLTQRMGGTETKLAVQVQQLTKELDDVRISSGLQALQLQKTLESQKLRVQQLEGEKRDLLQEAESMNATVASLYQSRNEKQVELDQLKATWKELQAEHADLKESFDDVEANYESTTNNLNRKVTELQQRIEELSLANDKLVHENKTCSESFGQLKSDFEVLNHRYSTDHLTWGENQKELQRTLEEKTQRLEEMMDMLTQLRSRNEFLEQARAADDQNVRLEFDKFQQQLLALSQEKKRIEMAYTNAKNQLDQVLPELYSLKEEKRHYSQSQGELEEEVSGLKGEVLRLQGELDRISRARSALQVELNRVTNEGQDVVRQFEVLRRDTKAQEKRLQDDAEQMRKEIEDLRQESSEASAMVEELQTKMTSVQNAANATINELISELQNTQDTMGFDKSKLQKENEMLKSQVRSIEEDMRKKDADVKEIQSAFRQEKDHFSEKENELTMRVSRLSASLDARKQDVDRLSKELEAKGLKAAEYERKLNPLMNARDNLQAKCSEMKQALEVKIREAHDIEERFRDELARAMKDKRDIETMFLSMKEDYEMIKSQSNGQQQQWQSEFRAAKHTLERTKADLMKANAEVLALTQRLEACQHDAQDTITELATRLQGADQQKEAAVNALQREINLERERRREAEVQKMELQRAARQRNNGHLPLPSGTQAQTNDASEDTTWDVPISGAASHRNQTTLEPRQQPPPRGASAPEMTQLPEEPKQLITPIEAPADYRKFYANEPMTNAELANLPMNLIRAQIGLDLAHTKSPTKKVSNKIASRAFSKDNNDDIPLLFLEKLPQNPEASEEDGSPTYETNRSSRVATEKRSGAVFLLESLSARSNSDRYLLENLDNGTRPQRNSSGSSLTSSETSSSNNKRKHASGKKKRPSVMPSSSAAAAAAYGSTSSLPVTNPSPSKMKSNSKLLPRIQQ